MSAQITRAPSAAKRRAIPAPKPAPAPVTTARLACQAHHYRPLNTGLRFSTNAVLASFASSVRDSATVMFCSSR